MGSEPPGTADSPLPAASAPASPRWGQETHWGLMGCQESSRGSPPGTCRDPFPTGLWVSGVFQERPKCLLIPTVGGGRPQHIVAIGDTPGVRLSSSPINMALGDQKSGSDPETDRVYWARNASEWRQPASNTGHPPSGTSFLPHHICSQVPHLISPVVVLVKKKV